MIAVWNKEQADLLRYIALAGGRSDADQCQHLPLGALIEAGFVMVQADGLVALTDAGLERALELGPGSRSHSRPKRRR
jgi:hypothetical protein